MEFPLPAALMATMTLVLAWPASSAEIRVERDGAVLHITADGKPVCDYQMDAGEVPSGVSEAFRHGAHLHPVWSPGGKVVTANHPEDHLWQRGIWLAWTKTEFGDAHPDFWNQGKGGQLTAEVRFDALVRTWNGPTGGFVSTHRFLDHSKGEKREVLRETWEVTVSQQILGNTLANVIDLTSTQTCAGELPLKLPAYHYGGLGVRGNPAWNPVDAVTMLTSAGLDRVQGDATTGKWVYLGGQLDGAMSGLAILIHPENFRFPQPLRLNPKNPQLCIAPSQGGDWSIEPNKPYVSRYRFLVFDGRPLPADLDSAWSGYGVGR
jgi:hypothetical protein